MSSSVEKDGFFFRLFGGVGRRGCEWWFVSRGGYVELGDWSVMGYDWSEGGEMVVEW